MEMTPIAVLTADWHLTDRQPASRTDDYWQTLQGKVEWIVNQCNDLDVPLYHAGDLFDRAISRPAVERFAIEQLSRVKNGVFIVAGNHDTPYHDLNQLPNSSFGVALVGVEPMYYVHHRVVENVSGCSWGGDESGICDVESSPYPRVLIMHHMVGGGEESAWLQEHSEAARRFLRRMRRRFDVVLTGHNHHQFVVRGRGSILVNPGSISRPNIDQFDHVPAVFVLRSNLSASGSVRQEDWEVDVEMLPIPCAPAETVLQDVRASKKEHGTSVDFDEFVERLREDSVSGVSFVRNVERYLDDNDVPQDVRGMVWDIIGEEND